MLPPKAAHTHTNRQLQLVKHVQFITAGKRYGHLEACIHLCTLQDWHRHCSYFRLSDSCSDPVGRGGPHVQDTRNIHRRSPAEWRLADLCPLSCKEPAEIFPVDELASAVAYNNNRQKSIPAKFCVGLQQEQLTISACQVTVCVCCKNLFSLPLNSH